MLGVKLDVVSVLPSVIDQLLPVISTNSGLDRKSSCPAWVGSQQDVPKVHQVDGFFV